MCIYIHIYYINTYIYTYITSIHICISLSLYLSIYISPSLSLYIYIYIYIYNVSRGHEGLAPGHRRARRQVHAGRPPSIIITTTIIIIIVIVMMMIIILIILLLLLLVVVAVVVVVVVVAVIERESRGSLQRARAQNTGVCEQTPFCASLGHTILRQKPLSSPSCGALKAYLSACLLLRRSVFFTDSGSTSQL